MRHSDRIGVRSASGLGLWWDGFRKRAKRRQSCQSGRQWGPEPLEIRVLPTVVTVQPVKDNTLFEDLQGDVSDGAGVYLYVGNTAQSDLRRAVLAFNIAASIPAGSTINSVSLTLHLSKAPPTGGVQTLGLHSLLADWGQGTSDSDGPGSTQPGGGGAPATTNDATWLDRFFGSNPVSHWTTAGGDFQSTASATANVNGVGSYTWTSASLVSDVQSWLDNPAGNFGWLLKNANETPTETARRFDSRENGTAANRPQLIIDYTAPPSPPSVTVGVSPSSVLEDAGGNLVYTFTRTESTAEALTVNFAVGGAAQFGVDYTQAGADSFSATAGTLTFAAGSATATITVTPLADSAVEPDEGVTLTVVTGSGYTVGGTATATGTIANDDAVVSISIFAAEQPEGQATSFALLLTRGGDTSGTVNIDYEVLGSGQNPADADDFGGTFPSGRVVFGPGETTKNFTVDVTPDTVVEPDETFTITITTQSPGVTIDVAEVLATILNDDTSLGLSPQSVAENEPIGTVVGTLTSSAGDTGFPLSFSLVAGAGGTDNDKFTISGDELLTAEVFDFETQTSYSIRVQVTDGHGLSEEQSFTITVTDANDTPSQLNFSPVTLSENAGSHAVAGTLSTVDQDAGETFIYSLVAGTGDTDNALFEIVGDHLQAQGSLDYETQASYAVRVRSTDSHGQSVEQELVVTLTDVNEPPVLIPGDEPVTFRKKDSPVMPIANVQVQEPDSTPAFGLAGGQIVITLNAATNKKGTKSLDTLALNGISTVGSIASQTVGPQQLEYHIQLNNTATAAQVQAFLRGIGFSTKGAGFKKATRTLHVQLLDQQQAPAELSQTIQVVKK